MELKVGLHFKDNSSARFEIINEYFYKSNKHFIIRFIEKPKSGELTIAKIENALSSDEFTLSEKTMHKLSKLGIIKKIN
jgi:hypothetical protein